MTRFALYLCRWQLSTPILWGVLQYLGQGVGATIVANLIGGCVFSGWIRKYLRKGQNDIKDT